MAELNINDCAVILAAGEGKRMKSEKPKVLCEVLGKPMVDYVIDACHNCVKDICIVAGFKSEMVKKHLGDGYNIVLQNQRLGTGHAVMQALDFIKAHKGGNVLVLCGDAPLMDGKTISDALKYHKENNNAITVVSAKLTNPFGYGRIVKENGRFTAITEEKDADNNIKAINEVNSGAYWFKSEALLSLLPRLRNDNAQGEYYLTDTIKFAIEDNLPCGAFTAASANVVLGANNAEQLEELNKIAMEIFK